MLLEDAPMRCFLLVVLVAGGAGAAEQDEDRTEAERQLEAGSRLLDEGQPEKARLRYEMAGRLLPGDPRPLLGLALSDSARGRCAAALQEIDAYLAKEKQPDSRALTVLSHCPRPTNANANANALPPPPTPPPVAKRRRRWFLVDLEAGLNIPVTSDTLHVDFLGTLELGVALSNKIGLDLVLFLESLVSRAPLQPGSSSLTTVFTENIELGLEERRVIWRHLSLFGSLAAGISVDSFHGFVDAGLVHLDLGLGWEIGPGEIRLRPLGFSVIADSSSVGASWRATAGYAFRF
jgi:hypothetical protein